MRKQEMEDARKELALYLLLSFHISLLLFFFVCSSDCPPDNAQCDSHYFALSKQLQLVLAIIIVEKRDYNSFRR